jgi:two-component system cell cycle sensor histidine kinase/response regulator CckA
MTPETRDSGALLEQLPLVTYVAPIGTPGSPAYVSPQIEALLGFPAGDWVSEPDFWLTRVAEEDRERFVSSCERVRSTGEPLSVEYRLVARDGRQVWVREVAMVATAADGGVTVQGFLTDITHEKELELALARERAQTDAFFRDSSVGMAITDAEGRYLRINDALARMHGHSAEAHLGRRLRDLNSIVAEHVEPLLDEVWRTGRALEGHELNIELAPGRTASVLVSYFPLDAAGQKDFGGIVIDVTDRKRAEQAVAEALDALRQGEAQFHAIFDNALDAVVIVDDEGCYVDANPAACELFGRAHDELVSLSSAEISAMLGSDNDVWRAFLVEGIAMGATTITRGDGTQREAEFTATANMLPGRHLSILRDVTGRKQLERALAHAQRLESVGTLAGGIAHDFNNMLMAISGYAHLLLARLAAGSVEHSHAEEIEHAADRAAKLTAQLLAFGRRQVLQPRAVDLNELVTDLSTMLSRVVGSQVQLEVETGDGLRPVRADPAQLEQVILNVVVNAAEAMPTGGQVAIRTRNIDVETDVEAADGITARELERGRYVEVAISDSGPGLDPDTLEHVFEPFFTTKAIGLGEGLGLSTAYGIVKQSGGTIVADSGSGVGATFRIYLPAAEAHHPIGGHETVGQR